MKVIYFIRHGQREYANGKKNPFYDSGLSNKKKILNIIQKKLLNFGDKYPNSVYCSPYARTFETAKLFNNIKSMYGLKLILCNHFGIAYRFLVKVYAKDSLQIKIQYF